jgi:nicotinamidase-related amidase
MTKPESTTSFLPLVLVDAQTCFLDRVQGLENAIGRLLAGHRGPVLATRFVNRPGSLYRTCLDWHAAGEDDPAAAIPDGIARRVDRVFDKAGYGLTGTALLWQVGAAEALVAGCDTDACVMAVAMDLWDAGIRPRVVAPACGSSAGAHAHAVALGMMRRQFGPLVDDGAPGQAEAELSALVDSALAEFRYACFDNVDAAALPRDAETARFVVRRLEHHGGRDGFVASCRIRKALAAVAQAKAALG